MTPLLPVLEGGGLKVPIIVVTVQYDYHVWELYYTTLILKRRHKNEGFAYWGQISPLFVVC